MHARENSRLPPESTLEPPKESRRLRQWFHRAVMIALALAPSSLNAEEKTSKSRPETRIGTLIIAGGGRNEAPIRKAFLDALPRDTKNVHATLIPTGTADEDIELEVNATQAHWKIDGNPITWDVLHTRDRTTAESTDFASGLDATNGVWMTGGMQERLTVYGRTITAEKIRKVLSRGGVVGGTSAGASIMSTDAIMRGNPVAETEKGLGITELVIDQHFGRPGRKERLLGVVRRYKDQGRKGIGIDEDTALVVKGEKGEVIGIHDVHIYFSADNPPLILHPSDTIDFSTGKIVRGKKDTPTGNVQELQIAQ